MQVSRSGFQGKKKKKYIVHLVLGASSVTHTFSTVTYRARENTQNLNTISPAGESYTIRT